MKTRGIALLATGEWKKLNARILKVELPLFGLFVQ
jgi:hypothetical protein